MQDDRREDDHELNQMLKYGLHALDWYFYCAGRRDRGWVFHSGVLAVFGLAPSVTWPGI
jgi:hypothetical protein